MKKASAAIRLLRPKQWTKNLLVFAALLFTDSFRNSTLLGLAILAFLAMSAASSATYVFNDLRDVEQDRRHPKKGMRPLAAGEIDKGLAMAIAILLIVLAAALAYRLGPASAAVIAIYLVLQVFYNLGLKKVPVADVFTIATGFVLRAVLGATAIDVHISGWLLFCTGCLALMLGFAKRRSEFVVQGEARAESRSTLAHYSQRALDLLVVMFATCSAICYSVYTLESKTADKYPGLILTAPFVLYGITRYLLLVFTSDEGGEPEDLLFRDPYLVGSILLFTVAALAAVFGVTLPFVER